MVCLHTQSYVDLFSCLGARTSAWGFESPLHWMCQAVSLPTSKYTTSNANSGVGKLQNSLSMSKNLSTHGNNMAEANSFWVNAHTHRHTQKHTPKKLEYLPNSIYSHLLFCMVYIFFFSDLYMAENRVEQIYNFF